MSTITICQKKADETRTHYLIRCKFSLPNLHSRCAMECSTWAWLVRKADRQVERNRHVTRWGRLLGIGTWVAGDQNRSADLIRLDISEIHLQCKVAAKRPYSKRCDMMSTHSSAEWLKYPPRAGLVLFGLATPLPGMLNRGYALKGLPRLRKDK